LDIELSITKAWMKKHHPFSIGIPFVSKEAYDPVAIAISPIKLPYRGTIEDLSAQGNVLSSLADAENNV
jgi:hypothetical protein